MPKIIENLESRLLEEAKKQLFEIGYGALTIRSVAKACGVGIGTVYNYFPSKDSMIALVMQNDLEQCISVIQSTGDDSGSTLPVLRCIYEELGKFAKEHSGMFRDKTEASVFLGSFNTYREELRGQIARSLRSHCESDFASEFVAEALLTWTVARKPFEEIYEMVKTLVD